MAHLGTGVEYALHCLLLLDQPLAQPASSRDLAELQGVSPSFLAKIFPKLEKAGIVAASEGIRGGYKLARDSKEITVLEVIDAVEGRKPLFDCQDIRGRCALFKDKPPAWMTSGVCSIHAVMLRAEKTLRDELARTTIRDLTKGVARKAPDGFAEQLQTWFADRVDTREQTRVVALKKPKARHRSDEN
ncbi:RrF2 family transcriptional regulator [Phyllobacterium sophorae]|uniref:Transcriptional regulator n=1 Tax=Phyllobacterium sophorae TaxID=1520277 RepID=A0A2P7B4X7_9HYPH|nr:Rrf2 family transcriptional regulator [Phyllobacterium sophorae]PSH61524.1 transcriptional regulator [Phyllobacterium sophorae]